MVRHDMPLPYYEFTELENNKWQVTCSIERLNIKETVSGGARHEVRGLVAEKVLGVVGDKGVFDDSAENKLAEVNDLFKIKSTSKIYNLRFKFQVQRLISMHGLSFSRILLMVFYQSGTKRWDQVISKLARLKGIKFMLIGKQDCRYQILLCSWVEINRVFLVK